MTESSREVYAPEWAIVIGGSAGALQPLQDILSQLDPSLPASVFVVVHTTAGRRGYLADVLGTNSALPVSTAAVDGEPFRRGVVYVSAPDRHLVVAPGGVHLTRGPREHHTRPAVDVLFRTAARVFGPRTIGVVLSGYGGDATSGSGAIRFRGGTVLVQAPEDAEVPSMPQRAIQSGYAHLVVPATEIAAALHHVITTSPLRQEQGAVAMEGRDESIREKIATDIREQEADGRAGQATTFSCPDCGGILWQGRSGRAVDFHCHIGHRWSSDTLVVQKTEQLEAALLTAMRLLKEKAMILHQTAARALANGHHQAAERLSEQAGVDERYAEILQRELLEAEAGPLSNVAVDEDVGAAAGEES